MSLDLYRMSIDPAAIELSLYQVLATKYWKVASLTILLYDHLLTYDREVKLIWQSPWGIGKILFLIARYFALIDVPLIVWFYLAADVSVEMCTRIHPFVTSVSMFGLAAAEGILFIRTSALYGNATKVAFTLLPTWAFTNIAAVVFTSLFLRSIQFGPSPSPFFTGCYIITASRILYGGFIVLLAQETVIVVYTIIWVLQTRIPTKDRLVHTLYRDGLLSYVILIVVGIGNLFLMTKGPRSLASMTQIFQRVIHTVLSTRVLLNARGAARRRELAFTGPQTMFTSFVPVNDVD